MPSARKAPRPFRVAVVGSGPAGFFLAERLLGVKDPLIEVDMYERLPTPYGLVRFGVAPDHEKIKNVTRSFEQTARREGFRFFGNVEVGRHVSLDDLRRHYHQVCFATGAQTDRRLGIPGEDLLRSHTATEFVAWYNGHPDYRDREFDLGVERVAVVGIGNVAVDVARMLCRTPEELARTDVADHALVQLGRSGVKEVYMLGRRGPAQAAFTTPEVRELGELEGADLVILPEEAELDPLSRESLEQRGDRALEKKVQAVAEMAGRPLRGRPRTLTIRFLVSPVEFLGGRDGRVVGMRIVRNRLEDDGGGRLRARATSETEELPVQLVFRSVGYRGVPIPGLPFDERRATVPNVKGRVCESVDSARPLRGIYVSGWIKRGPIGVIGTNKPDARETAQAMLEDASWGVTLAPEHTDEDAAVRLVRERQPDYISFTDWMRIDTAETERGRALGRPRVKFTSVSEMLAVLGRGGGPASRDTSRYCWVR
ncbi:MAG: FAD-dependent oxidoreductase [Gemmatimonadales bacterium]